ncbi:MAG TPA: hypothetical protein VEH62_00105 [Gemmatimonadales bacterium]|nr:hypothetical protein [Gemmatimonadales bacterium]
MPIGGFVNAVPMPVFLVIHAVALLIGAFFARKAFAAGASDVGWGFALYALAELSYLTYHLDWTVVLFAHTIAEVLDLVAFILIFAGLSRRVFGAAARR